VIILGESIHIISKKVREAVENRDKDFIQNLAKQQVEKGAGILDLNLGPQKKSGVEVMNWMVDTVQEVTDIRLSLDTTNAEAIEAGLKKCPAHTIINSTNADPERLKVLMPLAVKYDADLICLTLRATGLPVSADARVEIAAEDLMATAMEYGLAFENIIFDPLVMTVNGTQEHSPEVIKTTHILRQLNDPPFETTCGLSNVSNSCPNEIRPILNRVYLVMLMGAGMSTAIADVFDDELMATIRIIENRDASSAKGKLLLAVHDSIANDEEFDYSIADMADPDQSDIIKTVKVLNNQTLYAHGFLNL
jgi:5-methyltetrahydrofolate corrinoid/iron sulfur protein methyltransferase